MQLRIFIAAVAIIALATLLLLYPLPSGSTRPFTDASKGEVVRQSEAPRFAPSRERPGNRQGDALPVAVVRVIDGDTIVVEIGGVDTTVRLIGIDTPETVDPRKPVQCFGREASAKARSLLEGARVRLEYDDTQGAHDKYGRLLAYVFLADGIHFNEYMIREGYAHEYTYALPYRYQSEFKAAEEDARTQKRGLWHTDACAAESKRPEPTPFVPTHDYECSRNAYDCPAFASQAEAQYVLEHCGAAEDIHYLDADKDGRACELLP